MQCPQCPQCDVIIKVCSDKRVWYYVSCGACPTIWYGYGTALKHKYNDKFVCTVAREARRPKSKRYPVM